jgi:hypothetical protein
MPNWCQNYLEISHESPEMMERFNDAFNQGKTCEEFIPTPPEFMDMDSPNTNNHHLIEKYGCLDAHQFRTENWGTKWDFGKSEGDEEFDGDSPYHFNTAWSPPIGLYDTLEELGFNVKAYFYDMGASCYGAYEDGEEWFEDFSDMSYDELVAQIPEDIDNIFGVVAMFEQTTMG